jgi:hypothetical protein
MRDASRFAASLSYARDASVHVEADTREEPYDEWWYAGAIWRQENIPPIAGAAAANLHQNTGIASVSFTSGQDAGATNPIFAISSGLKEIIKNQALVQSLNSGTFSKICGAVF